MKRILFLLLFALVLCGASAQAQSFRVADLSDSLSRQADELADRAYNDFTNRGFNSRADVDNLMLAQQLSASANAFRRLVQDRRRDSELRDAASYLVDLSRRFPSGGFGSPWRDASRSIDDIAREFNLSGGNNGGGVVTPTPPRDIIGRVRWRGTVDDEVQLVITGGSLEVRTIKGQTYPSGNFNFTSALPERRVNVGVDKKKGRGEVNVLQQPTRENNFTTVIQIRDGGSGAKEYEVDVYWTRSEGGNR